MIQPGEATSDTDASTHGDGEFESAALDAIAEHCRSEWNNFYWATFGRAKKPWHYRAGAALPAASAGSLQRFCAMTQEDQKSLIWHAIRRWNDTNGRVSHYFIRHVPNPDLAEIVSKQARYPIEQIESDVPTDYVDSVFPDAITALFFVEDPHDPRHFGPIATAVLCFKQEAALVISQLSQLRASLGRIAANYYDHTHWTVDPSPVQAWVHAHTLAKSLFPPGLHCASKWTPHDVATVHDKLVEIEVASNAVLSALESRLRLPLGRRGRRLDAHCHGLNSEQCEHLWIAKALEHGCLHPRMLAAALDSPDAVEQGLQRVEPVLPPSTADGLMDFLAGCYLLGAEEGKESLCISRESTSVLALDGKLTPRGSGDEQWVNAMRVGAVMFIGDADLYPNEKGERRGGRFTALCSRFRDASTSIAVNVCPRGKWVHLTWRFAAVELP